MKLVPARETSCVLVSLNLAFRGNSDKITAMVERFIRFLKREPVQEATWNGEVYRFRGKGTKEVFDKWFSEYAPKAPICTSCNKLIFPGDKVGINGNEIMHLSQDCCDTGAFYAGGIDQNGQLIPAFEGGLSMGMEALRTGQGIYMTFDEKGTNIEHFDIPEVTQDEVGEALRQQKLISPPTS